MQTNDAPSGLKSALRGAAVTARIVPGPWGEAFIGVTGSSPITSVRSSATTSPGNSGSS